jgi:hypothetical protein
MNNTLKFVDQGGGVWDAKIPADLENQEHLEFTLHEPDSDGNNDPVRWRYVVLITDEDGKNPEVVTDALAPTREAAERICNEQHPR